MLSLLIIWQLCLSLSVGLCDFITCSISSHGVPSVQHVSMLSHHQQQPTCSSYPSSFPSLHCRHAVYFFSHSPFFHLSPFTLPLNPSPRSSPHPSVQLVSRSITFHSSGQMIIPGANVTLWPRKRSTCLLFVQWQISSPSNTRPNGC